VSKESFFGRSSEVKILRFNHSFSIFRFVNLLESLGAVLNKVFVELKGSILLVHIISHQASGMHWRLSFEYIHKGREAHTHKEKVDYLNVIDNCGPVI
jgi:hypothetical protein